MAYDSLAVANYFIEIGIETGQPLSPMKLQKLVFFAQGWHLALRDRPLILEQVEAWRFGPVIPTLYQWFARFGTAAIDRPAVVRVISPDPEDPQQTQYCEKIPRIDETGPEHSSTLKFLARIWEVYSRYTAIQLSNLTHEAGTPWAAIAAEYDEGQIPKGTDIPTSLIKRYFQELRQARSQPS